jgi:hypothetical protein
MSKKIVAKKETEVIPKTLENLVLDAMSGKYSIVPLAAGWAKIIRRREENRHLTQNDIIKLALRQVLDGQVTWKDVDSAASEQPADPLAALTGSGEKSKK